MSKTEATSPALGVADGSASDLQARLDEILRESEVACSPHGGCVIQSLCVRIHLAQQRSELLRSALLRATGSLGLIIGGANAKAQGHRENYAHARALLDGPNNKISNAGTNT